MNTLLSISAKICQFDTKLYLKEKYKHPVISSLLIIIVFFISGSLVLAEAQQNKIDSLTRIANASTSDSLKIDTFHQLFKLSYQNDLNASLKYIKEGLSIAKRAKSEKGSSLLIHDLGVFYWCT
ncbi:MAG TPA: hypothetical protein PLG33_08700, partial [Prolixibacteraceae bacterium]|nr:hypothetical protein [Prolixibacteraceae bacterium]